jgi:hypothetical protein
MVLTTCACTLLVCVLLAVGFYFAGPATRSRIVAIAVRLATRFLVVGVLTLACVGCSPEQRVRPLPPPPAEVPVCNLPVDLHQRNWLGPQRQGSCVHASLTNHLRWLNQYEIGEKWRTTYSDGEYASRLRQKLDRENLEYTFTEKADPRFLDWVTMNRTGCILWWKPSHCCTFMGWVVGQDGKTYAAILDNNYPGKFEYTEREQFIRLWSGYGGFGLAVNHPATISIPYLSYELL